MAKSKAERGRFSSRKKMDVVLRGDDLDLVSREAGITAATVSEWRDQFVEQTHYADARRMLLELEAWLRHRISSSQRSSFRGEVKEAVCSC